MLRGPSRTTPAGTSPQVAGTWPWGPLWQVPQGSSRARPVVPAGLPAVRASPALGAQGSGTLGSPFVPEACGGGRGGGAGGPHGVGEGFAWDQPVPAGWPSHPAPWTQPLVSCYAGGTVVRPKVELQVLEGPRGKGTWGQDSPCNFLGLRPPPTPGPQKPVTLGSCLLMMGCGGQGLITAARGWPHPSCGLGTPAPHMPCPWLTVPAPKLVPCLTSGKAVTRDQCVQLHRNLPTPAWGPGLRGHGLLPFSWAPACPVTQGNSGVQTHPC